MSFAAKGKRKAVDDTTVPKTAKKSRTTKSISKKEQIDEEEDAVEWPEYFISLFKVYKALNTVIAFCSSRKQLATTLSVVRSSVESILKRPLDLAQVAEIKALLPDLVRFAYIPANEIKVNGDNASDSSTSGNYRETSPDIYALKSAGANVDDGDHVLVMDFVEGRPKNAQYRNSLGLVMPAALGPQAVKNLIEKRNLRFNIAVNELIGACAASGEDPVSLLQKAAADHVPLDPSAVSEPTTSSLGPGTNPLDVPTSSNRPSIVSVIEELESQDTYRDQILFRRTFEVKEPRLGELDKSLSQSVVDALHHARGVTGFYTHQAQAINAIWKGRNVIISTSTASGKSIIYQVPVLCALEEDPHATAMFIYPTKALAQDQKAALEQLLSRCVGLENIQVATYDGDTPKEKRASIRDTASIIFTNFDMLHAAILPNEDRWRRFLKNMKLVVVDELHYYSGLIASHVALVMRRFRRVCAAVGNRRSLFISCSATISNPEIHMRNIFGVENIEVVTDDGAPAGQKDFLIWQPPLLDELSPELGRARALPEACSLMIFLMKRGIRTIVFCKIRRTCEMVMKAVRADLVAEGRMDIANKVKAYRGGYSQQDRRKIEAEAFSGQLLGLIATNALELGVDIGTLDAVISLGFPYTVASFRQQSGRAGRRSRDSLSVLVSDSLPIDSHFVKNPDDIFDRPMAELVVDLENKVVLEGHLQCAADEMPINPDEDQQYFGPILPSLCDRLTRDKDGWYHTNPAYIPHPSSHVTIRGVREDKYTVIDITILGKENGGPKILEEIEISRAIFETYEGGVFMHQGRTYVVKEVSHDSRTAKIVRSDVNWVTRPRDFTNVDASQTFRIREIRDSAQRAFYGRVDICTVVFGFFKTRNNVILDVVDIETPPFERQSTGMWVDVPKPILELLFQKGMNPAEGIHSAQHAVLSLTPLYAMSSSGDVKTECKAAEKEEKVTDSKRKRPARLIFYDAAGTGSGICAKAFDHVSDLLHQALKAIETCDCDDDDGCPSCIKLSGCKEGNAVGSKRGAIIILRGVLDLEINPNDITDAVDPLMTETVVEAQSVRAVEGIVLEKY